jgi:hypothetical protein
VLQFIAAFLAAAASTFGLYHHVQAPDLDKPDVRQATAAGFRLVTIRADSGGTAGGLGEFLGHRGSAAAFLYRRGTAVSTEDATMLERDHPGWVAHDRSGAAVTSNAGGTVIDITNPAVRDWLTAGVAKDVKAGTYDGVYLDVLGSFFSARFYSSRPVINGAPLADEAWRDGSIALVKAVKAATGKPVIANGFGLQSGKNYLDHKADSDMLIAAADGIQIEQFVRNGNMALDKYKAAARWREDVDLLSSVGKQGKIVLADTRVRDATDTEAVGRQGEYALASFLAGAEGAARFRFAEGAATGTVDTAMADTIAKLGQPKGAAKDENGTMVRLFKHGEVRVNPTSHDARIVVGTHTVTTAPPPREGSTRFYAIGIAAAVLLIGGLGWSLVRRRS